MDMTPALIPARCIGSAGTYVPVPLQHDSHVVSWFAVQAVLERELEGEEEGRTTAYGGEGKTRRRFPNTRDPPPPSLVLNPYYLSSWGKKKVLGQRVEEGEGLGPRKELFELAARQLSARWRAQPPPSSKRQAVHAVAVWTRNRCLRVSTYPLACLMLLLLIYIWDYSTSSSSSCTHSNILANELNTLSTPRLHIPKYVVLFCAFTDYLL